MRNFGPFHHILTNNSYFVANLRILCHKYCGGIPKLTNMRYVRRANNCAYFITSRYKHLISSLLSLCPDQHLSDCNLLVIFVIDNSDNRKSQFSAIYLQVQDFIGFLLHVMYNKIKQ